MKVHFIFIKGPKSPRFDIMYYMSIKSFLVNNPSCICYYHSNEYPYESLWFDLLIKDERYKDRFKFVKLDDELVNHTEELGIKDFTHKADYVRLKVLEEFGGIYSDLDNICLKCIEKEYEDWSKIGKPVYSIEAEMNHTFGSISNGFMYHPKNHPWTKKMISFYDTYDGTDEWVKTSILRPTEEYKKDPTQVIGLSAGLIDPIPWQWSYRRSLFMHNRLRFDNSWILHLAESLNSDYLKYIDLEHIMTVDTTFTYYVRGLVSEFWDSTNNRPYLTDWQ